MDHEPSPGPARHHGADDTRLGRLAELVVHLTDCDAALAMHSVARLSSVAPGSLDEALDIVAQAMCRVRGGGIDLRDQPSPGGVVALVRAGRGDLGS